MKRIFLLLFFHFLVIWSSNAMDMVDSLKMRLRVEKDPLLRCQILSDLSDNAPDGEWSLYNDSLGQQTAWMIRDPKFSENSDLLRHRANYFNNSSYLYFEQSKYVMGFSQLDTAYYYYKLIGDNKELSLNRSNLGAIYERLGQRELAIKFYLEAIKLSDKIEQNSYSIVFYNNLGKAYLSEGDTLLGMKYILKGLSVSENQSSSYPPTAMLHRTIGVVLFKNDKVDSAMYHFNKGLEISEKIGSVSGKALNQAGLAECYMKKGQVQKALMFADSAQELLRFSTNWFELIQVSKIRSDVYEKSGRLAEALESNKVLLFAKDSLNKLENVRSLLFYQFKSELAEKERIREEEIMKQELAQEMRTRTQYLGIISLVLIMLTSFAILKRSRLPQKLVDNIGFIGIILFFEFLELIIGPFIERYSFGNPAFFMTINIAIAAMIKPFRDLVERKAFHRKALTGQPETVAK